MTYQAKGFTLMETMIVLLIIGVLASLVVAAVGGLPAKARDTRRQADLSNLGKLISFGCYSPSAGDGDYDLAEITSEWLAKNPAYAKYISQLPQDPKSGTATLSNYRYQVADRGARCTIYANLERETETITLPNLTQPTPGQGNGILRSDTVGVNGSHWYYQVSR